MIEKLGFVHKTLLLNQKGFSNNNPILGRGLGVSNV